MEAPRRIHFWSGVSAISGVLRRRVYIDQFDFQWIPNFYIVLVAPPGVIGKSTTADIGQRLLRKVPGIHFGPDVITWQALVGEFQKASEQYEVNGVMVAESAITCFASELGNLLDPKNRDLVDLLITIWDNRSSLDKITKASGDNHIDNPTANIIACTTPSWLQENVPPGVVGGGLTSRIVFVYAEEKAQLVDLPRDHIPRDLSATREKLLEDLISISELKGEFEILPDAKAWSKEWYAKMWNGYKKDEELFGNYIARKQTHLMKLSMIISAGQRADMTINAGDLDVANLMLQDIEADMPKVFARMGRDERSVQTERFVSYMRRRRIVPYSEAYRFLHNFFPDARDMEAIMAGIIKAGYIELKQVGDQMLLISKEEGTT